MLRSSIRVFASYDKNIRYFESYSIMRHHEFALRRQEDLSGCPLNENSVAEDRTNCDNVIEKDLTTQSQSADVDILPAPERLRDLVRERELRYEGEEVYRALEESGELEQILDGEVKRMQEALHKLTEELKAKGYGDREAWDRAWGSVQRNWPFNPDYAELEEENHKKSSLACRTGLLSHRNMEPVST